MPNTEKRSFMAKLVSYYLKKTKLRHESKPSSTIINRMQREKKKGERGYVFPNSLKLSCKVKLERFSGIKVYRVNAGTGTGKVVLYLHGGAYVRQITKRHWKMIDTLAQMTDSEYIVPMYPLAPFHNYQESYKIIEELYISYLRANPNKKIFIMGDSSGGGFAAGVCETFAQKEIPQPQRLVLISPWLDVTLTNSQIPAYEKLECVNTVSAGRVYGRYWAGKTDPKNPMVSPLYGNVQKFPHTTIITGTSEILYPDIMLFYKKLKDANIDGTLFVGRGMTHNYPLYPIREANIALKLIARAIAEG